MILILPWRCCNSSVVCNLFICFFCVCHCVCHCVCFIVCVLFALFSSNVNCIVYAHMYVHSFSYCVTKLEIRWLYLSLIEIKTDSPSSPQIQLPCPTPSSFPLLFSPPLSHHNAIYLDYFIVLFHFHKPFIIWLCVISGQSLCFFNL